MVRLKWSDKGYKSLLYDADSGLILGTVLHRIVSAWQGTYTYAAWVEEGPTELGEFVDLSYAKTALELHFFQEVGEVKAGLERRPWWGFWA